MKKLLLFFALIISIALPYNLIAGNGSLKVVYQSNEMGSYDIWIMDADGQNKTRLTFDDNFHEGTPRFSPDGSKIVYVKYTSNEFNLAVMNSDGTNQTVIKTYPKSFYLYDWSNTDWIYFAGKYSNPCRMDDVRRIRPDGINEEIIVSVSSMGAAECLNGNEIVYIYAPPCWTPNNQIHIINIDGTNDRTLLGNDGHAEYAISYANTSEKFLFSQSENTYRPPKNIYSMNKDGSGKIRLTNISAPAELNSPRFSPDDSKIVLQYKPKGKPNPSPNSEIAIMDSDGSNFTFLTNSSYAEHNPDIAFVQDPNLPPEAICKDIEISADENCQASIVAADIDAGSYDPDEGDEIALSIDNGGPFSIGVHYVTLTVTDSEGETDSCIATVTVKDNMPPIPYVTDLPILIGECSVDITDAPKAVDNCAGEIIGTTNDPLSYTEQGTYTVVWCYNDGNGNITTQQQTVIVNDTTSPTIISLAASPNILWPPNHKMVQVTLSATVSENCDSNPITKIVSVTSNEPVNGTGDGDTAPDWEITGNMTINLRAERSGNGNGRIYTITVKSTDASGNSSTQDVLVTVLKNKKKK